MDAVDQPSFVNDHSIPRSYSRLTSIAETCNIATMTIHHLNRHDMEEFNECAAVWPSGLCSGGHACASQISFNNYICL